MAKLVKLGAAAGMAVALVMTALPGVTMAQNKTIEQRQKVMKGFGGNMKAIGGYVKAGKGSAADVEQRLMKMAAAAGKIPGLFPQGTDMDKLGLKVTGAKAAIWTDSDKFKMAADKLGAEARKFAAVVKKGDKAAIGNAFGGFGKAACGSCHRTFREKRPK